MNGKRYYQRRSRMQVALAALLTLQMATPCQAGLFDWLFRRKEQPVTVCCQPVVAACPTCVNRTIVNYTPQTVYTTSWVRVPVTTYRPVATTDPTTCCQVRYMQPSTSYVWQSRRQPHVIYKPFLSRVANACCAGGSCQATTGIPGFAADSAPLAAPGTLGPMITTPGAVPAGGAVAPYPASPYSMPGATGAGIDGAPAAVGPGTVPADLRPRLDTVPQTNQRPIIGDSVYPYDSNSYPSNSYPSNSYPSNSYPSAEYPSNGYPPVPPATGLSAPQSTTTHRPSTAAPPAGAPVMTPPNNKSEPSKEAGPSPNPVPDPEANGRVPAWTPPVVPTPNVPRLLNPSDRTAALQPRIAAPVRWATVRPAVYRPSRPIRAARQRTNVDLRQPKPAALHPAALDDSGWRPVRD